MPYSARICSYYAWDEYVENPVNLLFVTFTD